MMNQKIGIIMGGPSEEREISFKSGEAVSRILEKNGENIEEIVVPEIKKIEELKNKFRIIIKKSGIDIAFITLHGWFGEDGTVQNILKNLKIPYTGSGPIGCRNALNKKVSREIFRKNQIPFPEFKTLKADEDFKLDREILPKKEFPVVVKPPNQGSSIGLNIVNDFKRLKEAIFKAKKYSNLVLLEEYIENRELTVGIIGDKQLPIVEIVPQEEFYNFRAKYEDERTKYIIPARISKKLKSDVYKVAWEAYESLNCKGFGRVDIKLDKRSVPRVLEVNTIPGLTSHSLLPKAAKADNISFYQLCKIIIKNSNNNFTN